MPGARQFRLAGIWGAVPQTPDSKTQQPSKGTKMAMPPNAPATGPTLKFLNDLINEKDWDQMVNDMPPVWSELFMRVVAGFAVLETDGYAPATLNVMFATDGAPQLAQSDASNFINQLKKCGKRTETGSAATEVTEDGIYRTDGTIYKVYWNREQTRLLAKELIIISKGDTAKGIPAKVRFDYVGLASRFVNAEDKMPYDEAKEFGALYGICVYGHPLTDEVSIHLGIGPVCGARQFGGDFEFMVDQARLDLGMRPRRKRKVTS